MAKSNNQKGKVLYLARLLSETGEGHSVSMQDILAYLQQYGIQAERKSIYDDMDVLRAFGMDVRYRRGRPGGYYVKGNRAPDQPADQIHADRPGKQAVPNPEPDQSGEVRSMRLLLLDGEAEEEIRTRFGTNAEIKNREDGTVTATVEAAEDRAFYGWMTAWGDHMRLVRPKKSVQNYREYLKSLCREYKSVL